MFTAPALLAAGAVFLVAVCGDVALLRAVGFVGDGGAELPGFDEVAYVEVDGAGLAAYADVVHDFLAAARF